MFNYYEIEIKGKYVKNLFTSIIKEKINMYDIKYKKDSISFKINYEDYLKIQKIKTTCTIKITKIYGINKIKLLLNKYKVFFIFFIISIFIIYLFSNMIFFIKINNNNQEINNILKEEMISNKLTIYSIKKPYKKLKKISNKIKEKYNSYFEWLEISSNGVYYEINYIERKSTSSNNEGVKHSIVASKNGLIRSIDVEKGDIIKNVGDYVNKGDLIVNGLIIKNDEIKNIVDAKAKIYAEVWYKVKISYPFETEEIIKNDLKKISLSINIFDKEINIISFTKKDSNEEKEIYLINNNLFNIKISKRYIEEKITKKYKKEELIKITTCLARKEFLNQLEKDEKILLQKTLKIIEDNDKIYVEVFFKVYEDIAKYIEINPDDYKK